MTPESVTAGSEFRAAWRCGEGCEHCGAPHEWTATVGDRFSRGSGCPLCSGHKICRCRSLAATQPQLMRQWDWEGNQGTDPYSVSCCSQKKVSWRCAEHGRWDSTPHVRIHSGTGCPECARQRKLGPRPQRGLLKDELPDVYAQLHPTKNGGTDVEKLTCGSAQRVWWLCRSDASRPEDCQHEHAWEIRISSRCRTKRGPTGCPFCDGLRICPCKSLAVLQPVLRQYWDFAANAVPLGEPMDPYCMSQYSHRKVWWRHECSDGQVHHWRASISSMVNSVKLRGRVPCPGCAAVTPVAKRAERAQKAGHGQLIQRT